MIEFDKNGFIMESKFFDKTITKSIKDDIFCVFHNIFNKNNQSQKHNKIKSIDQLVEEIYLNDYQSFLGAIRACQNLLSLVRLSTEEKIQMMLKDIGLTKPIQSTPPMLMINSPKLSKIDSHHRTPPHQDWRSIQGSLDSIVVWIPLIDVDHDLGALKIVPSSHSNGLKKSVKDEWFRKLKHPPDDNQFIDVEMNEGDVLFFSTFLIHKSGNITSDKMRWSVQFRYNNLDEESFIMNKYPNPYQIKVNDQIINQEFFELISEPE